MCGWCQAELRPDGPSEFFCTSACQFEWNRLRGEALTSYREPTDLAAHVANQREESSPEVTPDRSTVGSYLTDVMRRLAPSWPPPINIGDRVTIDYPNGPRPGVIEEVSNTPFVMLRFTWRPLDEPSGAVHFCADPIFRTGTGELPADWLVWHMAPPQPRPMMPHGYYTAEAESIRRHLFANTRRPPACSHGPCRRPAATSGWCPTHAPQGRGPSFPSGVGEVVQMMVRPSQSSGLPSYTHTFTPGGPDAEEGRPPPPSYTVMRRGVLEIGPEGSSGPTVEVPYVRLEFDDADFRAAIGAALERLAASGQAAIDAVDGLAEVLDDQRLPTDPRERALELRRRRNTGPQQRQRAPRRINPRGCL